MNDFQVNTYSRYPIDFSRADGVYLYDSKGEKYLDFLSGIAVNGLGHNNEFLKHAAISQINQIWHTSNLFESELQNDLAKKLCLSTGLSKAFFCNSGTEAIEAALKFSRKFGNGRYKIISAKGGFHGRSFGSLSVSGQSKIQKEFHPLLPGFNYVDYNNIKEIENTIDEQTIGIIIEPIQGENGIVVPSKNYLAELRKICDNNNLLLIIDEIQTGFGRTGKLFSFQHYNVVPDILTVAKGIANGLPLGAVLVNEKIAQSITPGCHGSTFGGNPIAVAVANSVLDLINNKLLDNVNNQSQYLIQKLADENFNEIVEIRGQGLMIGLQIDANINVSLLAKRIIDQKIIVGTAGQNVLRLLPPLIIESKHIDQFVYILKDLFKKMYISTKAS